MAYRVRVMRRAAADMAEAHAYIFEDSPDRALRWYEGLVDAINSLSDLPTRCAVAPETRGLSVTIRQLLYGKRLGVYRVLFLIVEQEDNVVVLRVRHGARASLRPDELFEDR